MKTKLLVVLCMLVCSLTGMGQIISFYAGNRLIPYVSNDHSCTPYFAHVQVDTGLSGTKYADEIYVHKSDATTLCKSDHGQYVSCKYVWANKNATPIQLSTTEQMIFSTDGFSFFRDSQAFVTQDNHLYLVNFDSDEIIGKFDDIVNGELTIMVRCFGEPVYYIMNNGYVKEYHWTDISTAIKSRPADESKSEKAYNMSGMEVDPSDERVFIQDGKVKMNTK